MRRYDKIVSALTLLIVSFCAWKIHTETLEANPIELSKVYIHMVQPTASEIKFTKEVDCGNLGTVTVCTVCGQDYDQTPIEGETTEQCMARHTAKISEIERLCK